jgi:hypothetical protein
MTATSPGSRKRAIVLLVAATALELAVVLCILPRFKQFCGETAVYRIGLGLHACGANDEAADDFACTHDIGGWREALLWRDLTAQECSRATPHRFVPWVRTMDPFE